MRDRLVDCAAAPANVAPAAARLTKGNLRRVVGVGVDLHLGVGCRSVQRPRVNLWSMNLGVGWMEVR